MAIYGSLGEVNVGALSATISDTATDVFVYDTRKDSDGGQWRKRTQHTSWYNETLNTATRGSRRDFPAVAVIVASTSPNRVTIYDADDPDMPMWTVFTSNVNQFGAIFNNRSVVSIVAVNGSIIWADSSDSVVDVSFIKDNYTSTASSGSWDSLRNILDRNPTDTNNLWTRYNATRAIVSYPLNDVAMTVLPNAPIDSATGLPVPTIAVATNGGVSVIKDDGNVWDISPSPTSVVGKVIFDKNKILFASDSTSRYNWIYQFDIPNADSAPSYLINPNSIITNYGHNVDFSTYSAIPLDSEPFTSNNVNNLTVSNNNVFVGTNKKLSQVYFDSSYSPFAALTAQITTSYNTGWQPWNIKGAWLSDTSTASVSGTELVTNGTFTTNTTGWTGLTANIVVDTQRLKVTASSNGTNGYAVQSISTIAGKKYVAKVDITLGVQTNNFFIGSSSASANIYEAQWAAATRSIRVEFTALSSTTHLTLATHPSTTSHAFFDNISVKRIEEDRSVNNKGFEIYGTITKSAVATGSNLVAYSGFDTTTNYLEQPFNSALDFGTGDFSISVWVNIVSNSGFKGLIGRSDINGNAMMSITFKDLSPYLELRGANFVSNTPWAFTNLDAPPIPANTWVQLVVVRRRDFPEIYVNGKLNSSGWVTNTGSVSQSSSATVKPTLYIGGPSTSGFPGGTTTKLSLLRISSTAPSAEQILKMYQDERALFQPNSQCTLYGSSDAVTALAYDDTTKLLSVGTSSGRSDFQGLERINNTTTAVTTAISASNGLIAEQ